MIQMINISPHQRDVIQLPAESRIFLEGPAGTGKTAVGVERMLHLLSSGVPGSSMLIFVPQRTLGKPYLDALKTPGVVAGGMPTMTTMGGLAQRMVDLFWPVIAEGAGFSRPDKPPTFLNHETAQYYMARLVRPIFDEGYFSSVTINRNRIYGQILDNLNKSAVVGFPYTEIGDRLKSAWSGEPGQSSVYNDAQFCAALFRKYCLEHNLLDFSLQVDVFWYHLCQSGLCRDYLRQAYHHLIIENAEEDIPVAHDMLHDWLPEAQSALVIYDHEAGYRRFISADPSGAMKLRDQCPLTVEFTESYVTSPEIQSLQVNLRKSLQHQPGRIHGLDPRLALRFETHAYYPQMLDWITNQVEILVNEEGVAPGNIVVLAPILSDSLRFSIVNRLDLKNIPVKTHRPSRSLREEPATTCLLTLASLAHPEWGFVPSKFDVANSLMLAIDGLDLVRARILADIVYRIRDGIPTLSTFEQILSTTQERISYQLGEKYDHLRLWLEEYRQSSYSELDHFISRLFGEILSQPGYGFHESFDMGQVTAHLVQSVRNFSGVTADSLAELEIPVGKEYISLVNEGIVAAQFLPRWQTQEEDAVFIAPAYTFLINNYPVDVQFWLDIGNFTWSERLFQPLTHPYVLSRNWDQDRQWTDTEEVIAGEQILNRLVLGLLKRCRQKVYLGLSEYNEQGYEQRGPLLQAFHRLLQTYADD